MSEIVPAELREHAGALRLHGLLAHWSEVMAQPEQARWVAQLLAWEAAERGRRSLERRLREPRAWPCGRAAPCGRATVRPLPLTIPPMWRQLVSAHIAHASMTRKPPTPTKMIFEITPARSRPTPITNPIAASTTRRL